MQNSALSSVSVNAEQVSWPASAVPVPTPFQVTAVVNGCPVGVHVAHRWTGEAGAPALLTVSVSVGLTLEEVAAILFDWVAGGSSVEELSEANHVRSLVAETMVNQGCSRVDDAMTHTSGDVALLIYCRQRALAVFGPGPGSRDAADSRSSP